MRTKPLIIAERKMEEAEAFRDVQEACKEWPELVLASHVAKYFEEEIPNGSIIYNLEPLYDGCRSFTVGYLDVLKKYPVVDYQKKNVEYLNKHGINAVHMPYGYYEGMTRKEETKKDIDVLFFGSLNIRRMPVLMKLIEEEDINFQMLHGCYGKELDYMISRAKIHINCHYADNHPLELVRLNYLLANKCFVISEKGWDMDENKIYEGGVAFEEYSDFVEACKYYLARDYEREKIANEGFELIKKRHQSKFIQEAKQQMGIH